MKVTMDDLLQAGRPMEIPASLRGEDVHMQPLDQSPPSIPLPFGIEPPAGGS
jgi:hypothetical protein